MFSATLLIHTPGFRSLPCHEVCLVSTHPTLPINAWNPQSSPSAQILLFTLIVHAIAWPGLDNGGAERVRTAESQFCRLLP